MDYEKKYKEALEWMQSLYDGLHGATKEDAEHYFPELKESEEERIRKAIIAYISHDQHCGVSNADMIAWLKKQGEKKPAEDVKTIDADKVIEWLKNTIKETKEYINDVHYNTRLILPYNYSIEDLINDFKEDFGLC